MKSSFSASLKAHWVRNAYWLEKWRSPTVLFKVCHSVDRTALVLGAVVVTAILTVWALKANTFAREF